MGPTALESGTSCGILYSPQKTKLSFLWKLELNAAEQVVYHFFMVSLANQQTIVKLHLTKRTDSHNSFLASNILNLSTFKQKHIFSTQTDWTNEKCSFKFCKYYTHQWYVSPSIETRKFYLCVCIATLCPYWLLRGIKPYSQITIQKWAT